MDPRVVSIHSTPWGTWLQTNSFNPNPNVILILLIRKKKLSLSLFLRDKTKGSYPFLILILILNTNILFIDDLLTQFLGTLKIPQATRPQGYKILVILN